MSIAPPTATRTDLLNVSDHVAHHAATRPAAAALRFEGRAWSYGELHADAGRAANVFSGLGARSGDRIAIHLPNMPEFVIAYLGALRLGLVPVSLSPAWRAEVAAAALLDVAPAALITTPTLHGALGTISSAPDIPVVLAGSDAAGHRAPAWRDALLLPRNSATTCRASRDTPAAILYSSGTTATPRGVVLSHSNVATNARLKAAYCGLRNDDRVALAVPLSHCYGQNAVMNAAFHAGACVELCERFDAALMTEQIAAGEISVLFGVPPMFSRLLDAGLRRTRPRTRLRYALSAATTMPATLRDRWRDATGIGMHEAYGLTESSPFAAYGDAARGEPRSLGTPIRGVRMKVVDPETGAERDPGDCGEIAIQGHNVMLGYWNRPAETAHALRGGWLRTGDIGFADDHGHCHLVNRAADLVKVSGFRVFPATVEAALEAHPFVTESVAFGVLDDALGERIEVAVLVTPEWRGSGDQLRAHCAARLASYEVPARVHICRELPRSPTGKILRPALRAAASHSRGLQGALDASALLPT